MGSQRAHIVLPQDLIEEIDLLATAAINIAEVYGGMRPGEEARTEAFLSSLECYPVTVRSHAGPAPSRVPGQEGAVPYRWQT
jgi:hypothetical protein